MNMAMHNRPDLPTPYPVGVGAMGDGWADSLFMPQAGRNVLNAATVTPWTQWTTTLTSALPGWFGGGEFVNSYTGPDIPNAKYAANVTKTGGTNYKAVYDNPIHDDCHDTGNLLHDMFGTAPGCTNASWLTANWKWIALLAGGAVIVKYLIKRN